MIHGGAWAIPAQNTAATLAGIRAATLSGWDILQRGGSAVDAVEAAVQVMEDDPIFVSLQHMTQTPAIRLDSHLKMLCLFGFCVR